MGNRFNYRCPQWDSADEIDICAFVSIRLTADGAEIAEEVQNIDGSCWRGQRRGMRRLRLRGRGQGFFSVAAGRDLAQ
jgi:hypothetical protein